MEYNGPKTADDWDLYTASMACGTAARGLTAALKRTIKKVESMTMAQVKKAGGLNAAIQIAHAEHMAPAMDKYAEYGAADTEPGCVAARCLRQHFDTDISYYNL
jgi:hypothetical protein